MSPHRVLAASTLTRLAVLGTDSPVRRGRDDQRDASSVPGVCSNATAPSVSSINRILRNRAAERAAAEFARAAGYGLYAAAGPHPYFNSHQHPTTSHHLPAGWPAAPGAAAHPWMLPPLAGGITGAAASALLLPPSLSPGAAAAAAAAASASAAGTTEHVLHAADAIARGYLQGDDRDSTPPRNPRIRSACTAALYARSRILSNTSRSDLPSRILERWMFRVDRRTRRMIASSVEGRKLRTTCEKVYMKRVCCFRLNGDCYWLPLRIER